MVVTGFFAQCWEVCAARCMSWDEGPCKSFDWRALQSNLVLCRLSHADQHSNPENMIQSVESVFQYVENSEGKNTLSQSFDQENNYIKSGNVKEFYLSEFVKMDSASNYTINVYRRRTVCGQHAIATYWYFCYYNRLLSDQPVLIIVGEHSTNILWRL